jgi:hypothetical protein
LTSEHSRGTIRIRVGAMAQSATPVQLKEQTLKDSSAYILEAASVMERTLSDVGSFLWSISTRRGRSKFEEARS